MLLSTPFHPRLGIRRRRKTLLILVREACITNTYYKIGTKKNPVPVVYPAGGMERTPARQGCG